MFDPETKNLWLEVEAATTATENHVEYARSITQRYAGRFYDSSQASSADAADPENFVFSFVSNMLPSMGLDNPRVNVTADRIIGHRDVAQAMRDGINAWIPDVGFGDIVPEVILDFFMSRGVFLVYLDEDKRFSRGTVTPMVERIDPRRFFLDTLAESPAKAEFMGHWSYMDIDDLLADERTTEEALAFLAGDGEDDDSAQAFDKPSGSELGRRRVKVFQIWVRSTNTVRHLLEGESGLELFEADEFFGPPTGPYILMDAYPVVSQTWPLSPLVAVEEQNRDLNVHTKAMGRSASRRKSGVLVEASNNDLGDKLVDFEDGEILPVKGITGNHVNVDIGGITGEQVQYVGILRDRLDRVSGMTATVQGSVGSADTATEAQIADDAMTNRVGYLRRRVREAVSEALDKVAWYLFHTEGIIIPVSARDPLTGEQREGLFFGGPWPTDMGAEWGDFSLEMDVYSLGAMTPQARQTQLLAYMDRFMAYAQMAPAMPWVRWMNVLRDLDEAFDLDKTEDWLIPEMFGSPSVGGMTPPSQLLNNQQAQAQPGQGNTPMPPQNGMVGAAGGAQMGAAGGAQPGGFNQQGQANGPQIQPSRSTR